MVLDNVDFTLATIIVRVATHRATLTINHGDGPGKSTLANTLNKTWPVS
jgi:Flp pilus assembly CpaF family ATPase